VWGRWGGVFVYGMPTKVCVGVLGLEAGKPSVVDRGASAPLRGLAVENLLGGDLWQGTVSLGNVFLAWFVGVQRVLPDGNGWVGGEYGVPVGGVWRVLGRGRAGSRSRTKNIQCVLQ